MEKRIESKGFTSSRDAFNEKADLKDENRTVCIFGMFLILVGSIASFIWIYFILKEDLFITLLNSGIMFAIGIILPVFLRALKNEVIKTYLFSAVFSAYLIFVVIQYYAYIGPAVWTIALIVVMISILYKKRTMLIIVAATVIILVIYAAQKNIGFDMWSVYYAAQFVTFAILFIVILYIHRIIINRADKIYKQYEDIYKSGEKLYLTLKSVGDGVITVNEKGHIEFINPVAQQLTGWNQLEGVGRPFNDVFKIINEFTKEEVESPVDLVFEKKQIIEMANHTMLISKDGEEKPIEDTAAPIMDDKGNLFGAVLVFRDFGYKKEKQRQIEYLSFHDQLTGLYNRRYFDEEFKRLDTQRNLPLSIIYADLNGLKTINDFFGHQMGDRLIQEVAEVFKKECRTDDIIARVGGDEFIMLLPKTESVYLNELVKRIELNIEEKQIAGFSISLAFGWDTKNTEHQSADEVLKKAEKHMYQKKMLSSNSKGNEVIKSIINMLRIKSPQEDVHSKRVSQLCKDIGKAYNLREDEIIQLQIAGEMHDIGKIAIDKVILEKTDELSKAETAQIRLHPETGFRLLSNARDFYNIAEYVLAHHEKWDGTGYPKELRGEAIPMFARIITIADAYDVMTNKNPYKAVLSKEEAIAEIKKNAGKQFDPEIARIFVEKVLGAAW